MKPAGLLPGISVYEQIHFGHGHLHILAKLRTDANRSRWTEAISFRAPHKPLSISCFWKPTSDICGVRGILRLMHKSQNYLWII